MIDLASLAVLARDHAGDLHQPVAPLQIGSRTYDTDSRPVLMGVVNLSRDSTYRESVAVSVESALRKARVAIAQGADCVDIGAESSTAAAARVSVQDQIASLVPVVRALADEDIAVSVEGYDPEVVEAGLDAGARIVNLTGAAHDKEMFDLIAEYRATLVLCQVDGANVREVTDADRGHDPIPGMIEHFAQRLAVAREQGVERIVIDPGMGFYYGNLTDPMTRAQHQTMVLLNSFRLRRLGLPVCHALPHAFDLFEDEFRTAEAFFAVLARLGGAGVLRTHEVPRVRATALALAGLDPRST